MHEQAGTHGKVGVGRRQRRREQTVRRLLDAAEEVIGRRGLDASVSEITEAADTGFGTLYSYFHGKDDLVRAVIDEQLTSLQRDTQAVAADAVSPVDVIARKVAVSPLRARADASWALFHIAVLAAPSTEVSAEVRRRVGSDLRAGVASGDFRSEPIDVAALYAFAGHGAALERLATDATLRADDDASLEFVTHAVGQFLVNLGVAPRRARTAARRAVDVVAQRIDSHQPTTDDQRTEV